VEGEMRSGGCWGDVWSAEEEKGRKSETMRERKSQESQEGK